MKTMILISVILLAFPLAALSQLDLLVVWDDAVDGEQFGISISAAGDGNGDAWADVAVGAGANDEGGANAGKVSVYLGRPAPLETPDLEIFGPPGSFFGSAVAWVGDVDDDGYDDLLVGAYRDTQAGALAGKALLFLGGDPMDGDPDLVLAGPDAGAYFGRAVGSAGDIDADGYADFAVGAPRTANGNVYVYFGGDPPDDIPELVIFGEADGDRFGAAVAGPANVDGVPGDDLLVGAPRASTNHAWEGAIYLFSGGAGFDGEADWFVRGEGAGDQLGTAVAAAGDVNGDGDPDLVAGAPYWNATTAVDAGAAYLFFGGAPLDTVPDYSITGTDVEGNLGRSVAGCGDVTGNGYGHVLVGAPGARDAGVVVGGAVLSPGGAPPVATEHIVLHGEDPDDRYGHVVSGHAGPPSLSFSGDPKPDIAVGAWSHGTGGAAYVYGEANGASVPDEAAPSVRLYPLGRNPASKAARISFDVPAACNRARLCVYDVSGRLVRNLLDAPAALGRHDVAWDLSDDAGTPVASGVYFIRLDACGRADVTSAVVVR